MAGSNADAWGVQAIGRMEFQTASEPPHTEADSACAPPNPYARHPVGARDRSQPGTKWCLWEVLKDYRRGLPISDMLREIVNRGLRNFEGNKNPLGQIAGDLVRDRAHFFHFAGTNIWCLRCYVPQKLLEESGEPPPVARIAKEARPRPDSEAGRGSGSRKQQAQARGNHRAGSSGSAASVPARAAPRRAASAGVATAVAAAAHGPAAELDPPSKSGAPGAAGVIPAAVAIARSISDSAQQHASAPPGMALHALLAMQQASQVPALPQAPLQQPGAAAGRLQLTKQQLVRMYCKIWFENEGNYKLGEVIGYDPSSDLHQVSYVNRDMDLGIRFLSYEVVAAPEAPNGLAVVVQRQQLVPQLSARSDVTQAPVPRAAQPAPIRRACSADRAEGDGHARLIRPIARSFVTPQPSSPLDTANSPWTALMQASGGSLFPSPAGAFMQPGDLARPGSGAWPGTQSPLSTLAALSPPGLPAGWFSQPLPMSRAASATAAELQQAGAWQAPGLHSVGSGLGPFAPAVVARGLPPYIPPASAMQLGSAEAAGAAPVTAAAMSSGLTLQDVVRAGLITPAGPHQQSTAQAADHSSARSQATAGAQQAAVSTAALSGTVTMSAPSKHASHDVVSLPNGHSTLVTAGGSDASAETGAGHHLNGRDAHFDEDTTTVPRFEGQRHVYTATSAHATAATAAGSAGDLLEGQRARALQGPAAFDQLPEGHAATQQAGSNTAMQPYGLQPHGSTLDKRSNEATKSSGSAVGVTPIIGGAKRARLGGSGDQHFVQQPLSVAQ